MDNPLRTSGHTHGITALNKRFTLFTKNERRRKTYTGLISLPYFVVIVGKIAVHCITLYKQRFYDNVNAKLNALEECENIQPEKKTP